jgi:integrase/recombinase XerD
VPKRVSAHFHSTAPDLLRAGVDINTIRAWLGRVSLQTTNVYAEIGLETKPVAKYEAAGASATHLHWLESAALMGLPTLAVAILLCGVQIPPPGLGGHLWR